METEIDKLVDVYLCVHVSSQSVFLIWYGICDKKLTEKRGISQVTKFESIKIKVLQN